MVSFINSDVPMHYYCYLYFSYHYYYYYYTYYYITTGRTHIGMSYKGTAICRVKDLVEYYYEQENNNNNLTRLSTSMDSLAYSLGQKGNAESTAS